MIVGVIVGGVVAIALLFGALLLLRRRAQGNSRARQDISDVRHKHERIWALAEMSGQAKALMLMGSSVYEVDGNSRASELSTPYPSYTRAELPGK
jgi:biopolymer transport protein ExbB/TolQ